MITDRHNSKEWNFLVQGWEESSDPSQTWKEGLQNAQSLDSALVWFLTEASSVESAFLT